MLYCTSLLINVVVEFAFADVNAICALLRCVALDDNYNTGKLNKQNKFNVSAGVHCKKWIPENAQ